jgi:hypothetical protein
VEVKDEDEEAAIEEKEADGEDKDASDDSGA